MKGQQKFAFFQAFFYTLEYISFVFLGAFFSPFVSISYIARISQSMTDGNGRLIPITNTHIDVDWICNKLDIPTGWFTC